MAPRDDKARSPSRVVLGHIAGLYGVQGWVKLHSYTEPREAILDYREFLLNDTGHWREASFVEGRKHGKGVVAHIADIDDRDDARAMIGAEIAVSRDQLPDTAEGHYYWADLEGLRVVDADDRELGTVDHLLATGANDVLVVQGEKEILIPFLYGTVIREVDLDEGRIHVDWEWE